MSHSDQDIPTLTDLIRAGDDDMHHHFDAHQFSIDQDTPWAPTDTDAFNENGFTADAYSSVNLADNEPDSQINHHRQPENETHTAEADSNEPADFDPLHIAAVEIDQMPAELAPFDPALVDNDTAVDETDEYLELDVQEVTSPTMPSTRLTENELSQHQAPAAPTEAIRQQIDQAVDELLPGIAEQLKLNLYHHFKCQRDTD